MKILLTSSFPMKNNEKIANYMKKLGDDVEIVPQRLGNFTR